MKQRRHPDASRWRTQYGHAPAGRSTREHTTITEAFARLAAMARVLVDEQHPSVSAITVSLANDTDRTATHCLVEEYSGHAMPHGGAPRLPTGRLLATARFDAVRGGITEHVSADHVTGALWRYIAVIGAVRTPNGWVPFDAATGRIVGGPALGRHVRDAACARPGGAP